MTDTLNCALCGLSPDALAKAEAERDAQSLRADRHLEGHQQACDRLADRIAERDAARAELADAHKQLDEMEREVTASTDDCPHGETTWTCCSYCHLQTRRQRDAAIIEAKALREAMVDVITISDRKHDAWDRAKAALAAKPDPSLIVVSAASVREREESEARYRAALVALAFSRERDGLCWCVRMYPGPISDHGATCMATRAALANAPDTRLRVVMLPEPETTEHWTVTKYIAVELLRIGSDTTEVAIVRDDGTATTGSIEQARSLALALLAAAEQGGGK